MPLIISPRQLTQRAQFYQQLSQLTAAGIPIINALDMLARNPPTYSYRAPTEQLVQLLKNGATVSEAMVQLGNWVPPFDIALVRAGETSGRLDAIFKLLGKSYEDRAALLRQMISDLMYPVFLIHLSVLVSVLVSWLRSSLGPEFLVLEVAAILAPFYIVTAVVVLALQGKRGQHWRALFERVIFPVPIAGAAVRAMALARLSVALEALINAGVTIVEAWEMAAAASGSPAIKRVVRDWKADVAGGKQMSEVINAAPNVFPEVFRNLYLSGEVSGQLDESLGNLYNYYQEEGTRKLRLITRGVPKVIYFAVSIYIGYVAISFFSHAAKEIDDASKI
jgi:type IV pilus assembly protein PilC